MNLVQPRPNVTQKALSVVGDAEKVRTAVQEAKFLGYIPTFRKFSIKDPSVEWEALISNIEDAPNRLLETGWVEEIQNF